MAKSKKKKTSEITRTIEIARTSPEDSPQYKRAIAKLREWNAENAKKANYNLRSLERGDMRRYAYGRAINYVQNEYGSNSFKGGKALSLTDRDLIDQVQEIDTFLGRKTSTLRGAREMERARGEYLTEALGIDLKQIAKDVGLPSTKSARTSFFRFLGTDSVATFLKDVSGYYKVVLEGVATQIMTADDKRSTVDRLTQAIDAYLAGEKRYDTLLTELGVDINDLSDTAGIYR